MEDKVDTMPETESYHNQAERKKEKKRITRDNKRKTPMNLSPERSYRTQSGQRIEPHN